MKKFLFLFALLCLSSFQLLANSPVFEECEEEEIEKVSPSSRTRVFSPSLYVGSWSRYKINFGMEKIFIRFPNRPLIAQENGLLIGSAADQQVVYKFIGYFPSIGNIDPVQFFKRETDFISTAPFVILGHSIYQASNGDWVMDYAVHDTYANVIVKHRSIVTPFNAYTMRAIFPNGYADRFDYFLESFRIQCQCND